MKRSIFSLFFTVTLVATPAVAQDEAEHAFSNYLGAMSDSDIATNLRVAIAQSRSAEVMHYLALADITQSVAPATTAAELAALSADQFPLDRNVQLLLAYSNLKAGHLAQALQAAREARRLGGGVEADLLEASTLMYLATISVVETTPQGVSARPSIYPPGDGPVTDAERQEWMNRAASLIDNAQGATEPPPVTYYIAGLYRSRAQNLDEKDKNAVVESFSRYLKVVQPHHRNAAKREFAARVVTQWSTEAIHLPEEKVPNAQLELYVLQQLGQRRVSVVREHLVPILAICQAEKLPILQLEVDAVAQRAVCTLDTVPVNWEPESVPLPENWKFEAGTDNQPPRFIVEWSMVSEQFESNSQRAEYFRSMARELADSPVSVDADSLRRAARSKRLDITVVEYPGRFERLYFDRSATAQFTAPESEIISFLMSLNFQPPSFLTQVSLVFKQEKCELQLTWHWIEPAPNLLVSAKQ